MNVKKRLEHVAYALLNPRRVGTTTTLAKAAMELDAVFLTHDFKQAKDIENQFKGLTAKSSQVNLEGIRGPFIIDHYANAQLLLSAARKIEELEKELQENHNKLKNIIEMVKKWSKKN